MLFDQERSGAKLRSATGGDQTGRAAADDDEIIMVGFHVPTFGRSMPAGQWRRLALPIGRRCHEAPFCHRHRATRVAKCRQTSLPRLFGRIRFGILGIRASQQRL